MLSVIVTPGNPERLAGLLAALVPGVVENLVREVTLVGDEKAELLQALSQASGAGLAPSLAEAIAGARSDWLLVAPPELRLADGWVERLVDHLREGGRAARLQGLSEGLLRPRTEGLVIARAAAARSAQGGLQQLRRQLGRGVRRLR
jgi:hypothetical protein